jgi:hypothetical protein
MPRKQRNKRNLPAILRDTHLRGIDALYFAEQVLQAGAALQLARQAGQRPGARHGIPQRTAAPTAAAARGGSHAAAAVQAGGQRARRAAAAQQLKAGGQLHGIWWQGGSPQSIHGISQQIIIIWQSCLHD